MQNEQSIWGLHQLKDIENKYYVDAVEIHKLWHTYTSIKYQNTITFFCVCKPLYFLPFHMWIDIFMAYRLIYCL